MMENEKKIYDIASRWLARLHAEKEPDWNNPQLTRWLEQSEHHRLAFAELSGYWFAVEEMAPESEPDPVELSRHRPPFFKRTYPRAILALSMLVLAWIVAPFADSLVERLRHDIHAPDGQVQLHTLADGSVITLAGETSIDVDISDHRRLITLYEGEAFFDVSSDPDRPFLVRFANGDVQVLGTHFGIISNRHESLVGVVQGRVDAGHDHLQRRILVDDELVVIDQTGVRIDTRDPTEVFAWTQGQLVFKQQSLERILRRLDHYIEGRIILLRNPGPKQQFSLVVSLQNTSRALDTLAAQAGLKTASIAGTTVLY